MTTWTTPKTWTATTLSVSDMNTHVRDNLNHLYERAATYSVYKSADESLNTSTTLQNDDALLWAVAANERWHFKLMIYATDASNGVADMKIGWSVPASTTMAWASYFAPSGAYSGFQPVITTSVPVAVFTESTSHSFGTFNGNFMLIYEGVVFVSSTAGTVNFKWAQNTSNGSNLTVKAGSFLELVKLA